MCNIRWFIVALAYCLCTTAFGQEKLPKEMVGTATSQTLRGGSLDWSITIDSQDPDGTLKGKLSWGGNFCNVVDRPFTGTYRDGALEITSDSDQARCGIIKVSLKRGSTPEPTFEGSASSDKTRGSTTATLKPR